MIIIKIKVFWRTMNTQGPHYDPNISNDILYSDKPVLKSDIDKEVKRAYGPLVDKYEMEILEQEDK